MNFLTKNEKLINNQFRRNGFLIFRSKKESLNYIHIFFNKILGKLLKKNKKINLNHLHRYIDIKNLNEFRLSLLYYLNQNELFKFHYFNLAREKIYCLVGNELMMQKNINLSIQFPDDDSSLLPVHSDVWSGDSPYEINLWVPLVNCYKTKSMYILSPKENSKLIIKMKNRKYQSSDKIFELIKKKIKYLNINKNSFLLFDQTLPHGNVVNREKETRISMNCRFKTIFSPYADKRIGEYFVPITLRSMTEAGNDFKSPFKI